MRMGFLAVVAALAAPLTTLAADPPVVFQTAPVSRILDDVRAIAKLAGGENSVKEINEAIKGKLGDKGFDGLDLERPILGYVVINAKIEDSVAVIAIPVTTEKEFLGLFERFSNKKLEPIEKGLYEFKIPEPGDIPLKILVRFESQHAYVGIGLDPKTALSSQSLVQPSKLFDPSDKALASLKVHFDRLPKEIREVMSNGLKELKNKIAALPLPPEASEPARKAMDEMIKLGTRYSDLLQDAKTATARVILDVNSGEAAIELALAGNPGSALAKSIAERKPSTNKFAGLVTKDTVAGLKLQLPLFAKEIQNAAVIGLEAGQTQLKNKLPQTSHGAIDEAAKGLIRTVKDGEFDLTLALRGPDKEGRYTAVGAVAFEDPTALEAELRILYKNELPAMFKSFFNLDVAKVGKTNIHQVKLGGLLPQEVQKVFGDEASLTFALAPHGIFFAFGPDAIDTLKTALEVKKTQSPVFEIVINPKRLKNLLQLAGVDIPSENFGTKDMLLSPWSVSIEGGKELRLKFGTNLKGFEGLGGLGFVPAKKEFKQEFKK